MNQATTNRQMTPKDEAKLIIMAAHGRSEKQNHVLRLHPGDRPCQDLRCGAYIPAA